MIYLKLFINFLIIGTLSFGGGYGMISLMREIVLSNHWLSEDMFMSFVAIAEATPGPLAVNLATFVGSSQGGFLGAFFATLGVVLPAFIILLLIAAVLKNLMKYSGTKAFLSGASSTPTEIQSSFLSARFQTCPPSNSQPSVSDSI